MEENVYDSVVIGSGPGGLTAAIYNVRADLKTVVIAGNIPGGQLTITTVVDNWPGFPHGTGGVKLMMDMQEQVKNLGVEIVYDSVKTISKLQSSDFNLQTSIFNIELNSGKMIKSRTVIVATGAVAKWLGLEKEKELIGRGISGCATCDGMFFKDQVVAVVGGGNVACEDAAFLSKIAKKVYLIHRRDQLRAIPAEAKKVLGDNKIEKIWNSEVVEINSDDQEAGVPNNIQLHNIKIKNNQTGEEKILPVNGLFVAIGRVPSTDFIKDVVNLTESGYIITGTDKVYASMTSASGIFAAGDCMDEWYRQAIVAAGAGAKASIDCQRWLSAKTGD